MVIVFSELNSTPMIRVWILHTLYFLKLLKVTINYNSTIEATVGTFKNFISLSLSQLSVCLNMCVRECWEQDRERERILKWFVLKDFKSGRRRRRLSFQKELSSLHRKSTFCLSHGKNRSTKKRTSNAKGWWHQTRGGEAVTSATRLGNFCKKICQRNFLQMPILKTSILK